MNERLEIIPGVPNRMCVDCGDPPQLDLTHPTECFENDYGEQGVMQFDMSTGECRVWMGDCGWANEIRAEEVGGRIWIGYATPITDEEWQKHQDSNIAISLRKAMSEIWGHMAEAEFRKRSTLFAVRPEELEAISDFYYRQRDAWKAIQKQKAKQQKETARLREIEERTLTCRMCGKRVRRSNGLTLSARLFVCGEPCKGEYEKCQRQKEQSRRWHELEATVQASLQAIESQPGEANSVLLRSLKEVFIRLRDSPSTAPQP